MSINVNVTYHGPNLTLSPTSNVIFKLGSSTPWALCGLQLHLDYKVLNFMKIFILIKFKTLQQKLTAHAPYLSLTTHCKKAHDMHHAMTFIHT